MPRRAPLTKTERRAFLFVATDEGKMSNVKPYACKRTVDEFVLADRSEILGEISEGSDNFCILQTQRDAWSQEIELLQGILKDGRFNKATNSIYFEFNLMRFAKRVDVVLILDGVLLCLEFKTDIVGGVCKSYLAQDKAQALAYADEFSQFHSTSSKCPIVPVLVVPGAPELKNDIVLDNANVYALQCANERNLAAMLKAVLDKKDKDNWGDLITDPGDWETGEYNTVPTIVEAAGRLFENQNVEAITRSGTDITKTISTIEKIIRAAEKEKKCVLCFVTGEPGAGKTLVGLQLASSCMKKELQAGEVATGDDLIRKVMLSGNYPLVKVLKESLVRDFYGRLKACKDLINNEGGFLNDRQKRFISSCGFQVRPTGKKKKIKGLKMPVEMQELWTISKFTSKGKTEVKKEQDDLEQRRFSKTFVDATVSSMIQMVSHFRRGWELSENPPVENVFVFDEAQRAWSFNQVKKKDKNTHQGQISNGWSEPRTLLEYLNRHSNADGWCVAIALVGHGQDIHEGEAGIEEWYRALKDSEHLQDWVVCGSDKQGLIDKGVTQTINPNYGDDIDYGKLHLKDMQRSFKSKEVGPFVNALLEGNAGVEEAKHLIEKINKTFPLYVTRDIGLAKQWLLKMSDNGRRRCGSVMSSRAVRLRAYGFQTIAQGFDEATWFLEPSDNINSSNALEISATEFKIQGLELDYVLVGWDGDLFYNSEKGVFEVRHFSLKANTWKEVRCLNKDDETSTADGKSDDSDVDPKDKDRHLRNAYRVLLTRARQGMVIFVPKGMTDDSDQKNLSHVNYDDTYSFLHDVVGIKELDDKGVGENE